MGHLHVGFMSNRGNLPSWARLVDRPNRTAHTKLAYTSAWLCGILSHVKQLGRHAIVDVSAVDRPLENTEITTLLADMARACGATLLRTETHEFGEGHGLTAIAVLAESHISVHEWPEHRFVAFDIFVCGSADPEPAVDIIRARFPLAHVSSRIISRESQ
jgi:S-adenosylmethionine decarboxylase